MEFVWYAATFAIWNPFLLHKLTELTYTELNNSDDYVEELQDVIWRLPDYPRGVSEAAARRCFEKFRILLSVRKLTTKGKTASLGKSQSPSIAAIISISTATLRSFAAIVVIFIVLASRRVESSISADSNTRRAVAVPKASRMRITTTATLDSFFLLRRRGNVPMNFSEEFPHSVRIFRKRDAGRHGPLLVC